MNFSQWMCSNAWIYRLLAAIDLSELSAPAALVTRGTRVLVRINFKAAHKSTHVEPLLSNTSPTRHLKTTLHVLLPSVM